MLLATDSGHCVVLVPLDLTASVDTVDHQVLWSCLDKGAALDWIRSFFTERSFCVCVGATEHWCFIPFLR